MSTSLLLEKAYRITNAKNLRLLRLCALCGKKWEMILLRPGRAKLHDIRKNNHFKDMNRIDGMPTEFEWKIFPGIMTLGLLEKIQSLTRDLP